MSDRVCLRGCTQEGVHYATCAWYGIDEALISAVADLPNTPSRCNGCAPVEARDGALICDRCYKRMRRHLDNAPDLIGRLRSLSDPTSATVYDRVRIGGATIEAPAPVAADLIDAAEDVMRTLRTWAVYVDPRSGVIGGMPAGAGPIAAYDYARDCASTILSGFDGIANNAADVLALAELVLVAHPADEHGERGSWSIVDAVSRYRLERPDSAELLGADDADDGELLRTSVAEWGDRLIPRRDAVGRAGVADSTFRRWVADEVLAPRATTYGPMGRVLWFRTSDVDAAAVTMAARRGRPTKEEASS